MAVRQPRLAVQVDEQRPTLGIKDVSVCITGTCCPDLPWGWTTAHEIDSGPMISSSTRSKSSTP